MKVLMSTTDLLLRQIDQAYNRRSWHGANLRGALRGMTADDAAWRPGPGRNSIQEIVVHAAYWKYVVRRRLTGQKRGSFPLEGSNWFARPEADAAAWKADVRLLDDCHRALRETVASLSPKQLTRAIGGWTVLDTVSGIAAHDLYHAGQIQLLKRLRTGTP